MTVRPFAVRWLRRTGLVCLGLAVGFALGEALSRPFLPAPVPHRLPWIRLVYDEHCSYRNRPSQSGWSLSAPVTINRWGFRGRDWTLTKPPGTTRVAVLGDSYAFGQGVGDDQTFAAVAERALAAAGHRVEVLNFAAVGYDTRQELKALEHHALRFEPDVVVLGFFLNDVLLLPERRYPTFGRYMQLQSDRLDDLSPVRWRLKETARRSRLLMTAWDLWLGSQESALSRLQHAHLQAGVVPPAGPAGDGWRTVTDLLARLRELAREHRFRPVVVVLPLPQELLGDDGRGNTYAPYLAGVCAELGIELIDVLPELRAAGLGPWQLLIPYDYHLGAEANRVVGEALARALAAGGTLATPPG